MSEEKIIRINKVLRELNISLERAVDYLKDKGIAIESNPNTKISDDVYNVLCGQFAGDKGNKQASQEVGEEKRKEKEALRIEREKEIEDKRKFDEERQKAEIIKAKVVVTGPVQVGQIDLNPKPIAPVKVTEDVAKPVVKVEKLVVKQPEAPQTISNRIEKSDTVKPKIILAKKETPKLVIVEVEKPKIIAAEDVVPDEYSTQYQKLSGATLTGQTIDLSQFNKPKKTTPPKIVPNKPGVPGAAGANNANKNKRKRIAPKPGQPRPPGSPGNATGGTFINRNIGAGARPGFVKGARPAITAKVEPTEEDVKNQIRETLEKLQGKGSKSKAAKYRRDKRDTHRQKSDDDQRALDEGSKTIKRRFLAPSRPLLGGLR